MGGMTPKNRSGAALIRAFSPLKPGETQKQRSASIFIDHFFGNQPKIQSALGGDVSPQQEGISPEEQQRRQRNTAGGFYGMLGG